MAANGLAAQIEQGQLLLDQCALSFRPDSALLSTRIIGNPKSFYNSRNTRTTKIKRGIFP